MSSNGNIKTVSMRRLANEGRSGAYKEFMQRVRDVGVPAEMAWKVALFAYSPQHGGTAELLGDPSFAEIACDWRAGRYRDLGEPPGFFRFPDGMHDELSKVYSRPADAPPVPAPAHKARSWAELEALVHPDKKATKQQIIQWAFHNSSVEVKDIDPETVPCRGATIILRLAKEDYRTFVDRWLKDDEKNAGPQELSDDCRTHLERCEAYEGYLQGERETIYPDVESEDDDGPDRSGGMEPESEASAAETRA